MALRTKARASALLHAGARARLKYLGRHFSRLKEQALRKRAVDVHRLHLKDFNFEKKLLLWAKALSTVAVLSNKNVTDQKRRAFICVRLVGIVAKRRQGQLKVNKEQMKE